MSQVLGLLALGLGVFVLWAVVSGESPLAIAQGVLSGSGTGPSAPAAAGRGLQP